MSRSSTRRCARPARAGGAPGCAHWRTLLGGQAEPVLQGWDLTAPEPARHVALDWRLARGGPMPDETPGSVHPDNSVGVGVVGRTGAVFDRACPAPQIEAA